MIVNLLSDTVTKPTPGMREAMMQAEVGDDVFQEDPTVNLLQKKMADLFGMEDALFCPSGTMANQIALKALTQPLDEIICDKLSHIYRYELGGYGFHSGASIELVDGDSGKMTAQQIEKVIKPDLDWYPISKVISIENSINMAGGNYYTAEEILPIYNLARERGLSMHLDGARLFNVLAETNESPAAYGKLFDTISICFSKGLGAPVGSIILGSSKLIRKARRIRKAFGGGMRQVGFLAAACIYALDHQVTRLKQDHLNAKDIANALKQNPFVAGIMPVKTNIVIFETKEMSSAEFVSKLAEHQIKAAPIAQNTVRFVLHLDVNQKMVSRVKELLTQMN